MSKVSGRHRSTGSASRLGVVVVAALLVLAALYVLVVNPISPAAPGAQAAPPTLSAPPTVAAPPTFAAPPTSSAVETPDVAGPPIASASPSAPTSSEQPAAASAPASAGASPCAPSGLQIADLGVDASVVQIGLDPQGNLGTPSDADKRKAGWYPSALAGAASGSVILTGHTYHDESAIFRTDFNQTAHVGMTVQLSCAGGGSFAYRVTEATLNLAVADYSSFVDSRGLYARDGPPQVVIITCTDWNPIRRDYDQRGLLIATPVT